MKKLFLSISISILGFASFCQQAVSIVTNPAKIYIERGEQRQYLNFDFLVSNASADSLSLVKIQVDVFDKSDKLVLSKFLDNNGTAPSIQVIPNREFNGVSSELIFNPFAEFTLTTSLNKLVYTWTFQDTKGNEFNASVDVKPLPFQASADFKFPLKGKVLVYDGHDLYSHHRRFNYEFAPIKQLGLVTNFMRYAYDFILVDANGKQFKNKGENDEDYYGLGAPVYAIGNGKVIYVANNYKDDKSFDIPKLVTNPLELYGNCVAIQHQDNTISIYGHLRENSVKVKFGDNVNTQQEIAAIGVSGSSFLPHLHFELRTSIDHKAEGVPSYFTNVTLVEGDVKTKLKSGLVETGNIVEAK